MNPFGNMMGGMPGMGGMGGAGRFAEGPKPDTSEQVIVSSLALLKMLKHARAGLPMEVMGLMLGEFVDEYTTKCVDVFATPQSGTSISVESVDPAFQAEMLEMLKQTERDENCVGWYHSHPGWGCWLSGIDTNTHQSFEQLDKRNVAVVIDAIQSVKGKVAIDAFKLISKDIILSGSEPRQNTSNVGKLKKPTAQALFHGLNKAYSSLVINYRKNDYENKMLLNLYKKKWTEGMKIEKFEKHAKKNEDVMAEMAKLSASYNNWVGEEMKKTTEEFMVGNVGKIDPKRHLGAHSSDLISENIRQTFGMMQCSKAF